MQVKSIAVGHSAGINITTGHHDICIGNGAGMDLTTESYRLVVKGKTVHGDTVDIDRTMSEEEHKLLYDVLNVVFHIINENKEPVKITTGNDSTNIGRPALGSYFEEMNNHLKNILNDSSMNHRSLTDSDTHDGVAL